MTLTLDIQLDNQQPAFRAGEPISGSITVQSEASLDCDCLGIALQHASQLRDGQGEVVLEQDFQQTLLLDPRDSRRWISGQSQNKLFSGPWQAGKSQRYPFHLQAPDTPGYLGKHLSLAWLIQVHAMVRNENSETLHFIALKNIDIVRNDRIDPPRQPASSLDTAALLSAAADPPPGPFTRLISFGTYLVLFLLLGVIPLFGGIGIMACTVLKTTGVLDFSFWGSKNDAVSLIFTGVAAFAFGCYMVPLLLRARRPDDMQLYVAPLPVRPGEKLQYVSLVHHSLAAEMAAIRFRLKGTEYAVGPGTDELEHPLLDKSWTIPSSLGVRQGHWLMFAGDVTLPADLACSVRADFGQLEYHLDCQAITDSEELLVELEQGFQVA